MVKKNIKFIEQANQKTINKILGIIDSIIQLTHGL